MISPLKWLMGSLMVALVAGCGGGSGQDPILGSGGATLAPVVTAVVPIAGSTGVPVTAKTISATFSKPMNPATLTPTSFTLACPAGTAIAGGAVSYVAANNTALLTLSAATVLPVGSCIATITTSAKDTTGIALASNYAWTFTTIAPVDKIRPTVLNTFPVTGAIVSPAMIPSPTTNVPTNTAITATFSKNMAATTLNSPATSFTLTCTAPCVSPAGSVVSYALGSRTATYTPVAALAASTTYTATITSAATDTALAPNALAGNQPPVGGPSNYVWTFTTAAGPAAAVPVTVVSSNPVTAAAGVCPSASINATFSARMDPATVNTTTFLVTAGLAATPVTASSIVLDAATGKVATFTPTNPLTPGTTYTATIKGTATGVKDLAIPANAMTADYNVPAWTFTAGPATGNCLTPVALGSVSTFGTFGGTAGMTNAGNLTLINGDIGTIATGTSAITGFHDVAGDSYTETCPGSPLLATGCGQVNGSILTCTVSTTGPTSAAVNPASCTIATQARLDAQSAYLALAALPVVGASPAPGANLAGLTLASGVYKAPAGSFMIQGGDLTLDAQGNANAVWVFQMATSLTVGGPGAAAPQSIILAGGAQAKNVFWQVGSAATINAGGGGTMVGTIISQEGAAFSTSGNITPLTLNGRVLSLGASVTLVNTLVNVPAP
jgi:hypothetical protein